MLKRVALLPLGCLAATLAVGTRRRRDRAQDFELGAADPLRECGDLADMGASGSARRPRAG